MIDTLRLMITRECNLKCSYCCNEKPELMGDFERIECSKLPRLLWGAGGEDIRNVVITGGEPLLRLDRIRRLIGGWPGPMYPNTLIVYTNGLLMNIGTAHFLANAGVTALTVGLHHPAQFDQVIRNCSSFAGLPGCTVRYNVRDVYRDTGLELAHPGCEFKYWHMDDCARDNERRIEVIW